LLLILLREPCKR